MKYLKGHAGPRPGCTPEPRGDHFAIPLHDRSGSVLAYTLISPEDVDWAKKWRWGVDGSGYARRNDRGRIVKLHREILGLTRGDGLEGDHINRDRLDNRRSNLRVVSNGENAQNVTAHRDSTSAYRGVSWNRDCRKWQAHVYYDGRSRYLGLFASEQDAAEAAAQARAGHMTHAN